MAAAILSGTHPPAIRRGDPPVAITAVAHTAAQDMGDLVRQIAAVSALAYADSLSEEWLDADGTKAVFQLLHELSERAAKLAPSILVEWTAPAIDMAELAEGGAGEPGEVADGSGD